MIFVRFVFSSRPLFLVKQHMMQIEAELPGFPASRRSPGLPDPLLQSSWAGEHMGQGALGLGSNASSPPAVLGEPWPPRFLSPEGEQPGVSEVPSSVWLLEELPKAALNKQTELSVPPQLKSNVISLDCHISQYATAWPAAPG